MTDHIRLRIAESIETKQKVLADTSLHDILENLAADCIGCLQAGGRILFCGNGGSAADAQHLAAELSGRFYYDRPPLPAEALHVNTSFLTAVANDYAYDEVFARLVEAQGRQGDVLIGLSTSGNSGNVIKAFDTALRKGMITAAFTGEKGGQLKETACYLLKVPSTDTARIQEAHILLGHILCEIIESRMFPKTNPRND
jgi:D-sedoheptulose 7-phosphate isomerase